MKTNSLLLSFLDYSSRNIKILMAGLFFFSIPVMLNAQNTGIGDVSFTPNPAAMLEITAGLSGDKGLLIPRVSFAQRLAMNPLPVSAQGLLIYQTNVSGTSLEGFYYNISTTTTPNWIYLSPGSGGGWGLTGNAGTSPVTNFIGTTDAQDLVIRTDGMERGRFLNTGEIAINKTTANSGEVLTVAGSGATGAISAVGSDAINGYSTASGTGVYGANDGTGKGVWGVSSGTHAGVRGDNISASTPGGSWTYGVYGSNNSVPTGGVTIGVGGFATAGSLDARGVNGQSESANGMGVAGFNNAPSGPNFNAHGVFGQTSSQLAFGVAGNNLSPSGQAHGVQGTAVSTGSAAGVKGINNANPGSGGKSYGVWGSVAGTPTGSGTVYGVRGECNALSGSAHGISGSVASATGFGVFGSNSNTFGTGIIGTGNNITGNYLVSGSGGAFTGGTTGLFSLATSTDSATGLLAVSNGAPLTTLAIGSGISGSSSIIGVAGWANSANTEDRAGGYFDANGGTSFAYVGAITSAGVNRKIEGNGTVNTTVRDMNDNLVVLSCPEAPENFFQDFGKGLLKNGKCHITLDPVFSKNIVVDDMHPLRVFIQLGGNCNGVYVDQETASGFDVTELNNGSSNAPFTWFVTANRADMVNADGTVSRYSSERFAPAIGSADSKSNQYITSGKSEIAVPSPQPPPVNPLPIENKRKNIR